MNLQRLGDDLIHGHARVERTVRVLENHLEFFPFWPEFGGAEMGNIFAFKSNGASGGFEQSQNGAAEGAFAAAAFADEAEGFAGFEGEIDAVDGSQFHAPE